MRRIFMLAALMVASLASFEAESQSSEVASEAPGHRWQLDEGSPCLPLTADDSQFFRRCNLGTLRLEVPQGFVLTETRIRARYQSQLPDAGQQASAILYTETEDEELRSFATHARKSEGGAMDRHDLTVDLTLPQVDACQKAVLIELPLTTTFFLKQGNGSAPQISFQGLEVGAGSIPELKACL